LSKNNVPARAIGLILSLLIGMGLGIYAIYLSFSGSIIGAIPVIIPAVLSIFMSSMFLYFFATKNTPIGNIKVKTGYSILPFEAKTSKGNRFHTDDLEGKRTLFKFYRGA